MTIGSVRPPRPAPDSAAAATPAEPSPGAARSFDRYDRRARIVLSCAVCGGRNYRKTKARREGAAPIQLKKFCNTCNAHTPHREAV